MGDLIEILTTSDSNGLQHTCCAWDPRTGISLMQYKGGGAVNSHGLCYIRNEFILTANSTKPLIHVWPVNSQDQVSGLRFVLPGKVNALALSPDGNYLIAGIQESIYVWQICSGKMMNLLNKHYQSINVIKFTDDGSHFISAGQDGAILVWNLTRCLSEGNQQQTLYSFNDHALPVTDLHVGHGGIRALLCSVSIDRTCKIYDLASGTLLLNLVLTESLTSCIMDILETKIFIGSSQGSIYTFSIVSLPRTKEYHLNEDDFKKKFLGHNGKSVTCLALSFDGKILASGGQNDNVHLWDIDSKQLLRTLSHKGTITNLMFSLCSNNVFSPERQFHLIAKNPKRMMEKNVTDHVVEIFVSNEGGNEDRKNVTFESSQHIKRNSSDNSEELKKLRAEVSHLKKINKELFQFMTEKILKE